jgi:hypothetical protein
MKPHLVIAFAFLLIGCRHQANEYKIVSFSEDPSVSSEDRGGLWLCPRRRDRGPKIGRVDREVFVFFYLALYRHPYRVRPFSIECL